jgi:hypothetical protein
MKFKTRADVVRAILRKGLGSKDRAFGRELNKYEEYYRQRTGYAWMGSDIYAAARVSNEFYVTNLYGLLDLNKEKVTPEVRTVIHKAALRYFGRTVTVNENIIYKSRSKQLEIDRKRLRKEVAKTARQQLESLKPTITLLKGLSKE